MCQGTIHDSLEIKFEEVGEDRLSATMPVSELTRQPFGLLHGGASVVLAESLGSMASFLAIDDGAMSVGIEVNANHIRAARNGQVKGVAKPIHIGRSIHVWGIEIANDSGELVCTARLTVSVREPKGLPT